MFWAVALMLAQAPAASAFEQAEVAYREGQFEALLNHVQRALKGDAAPAQRVRLYHLKAMAHAAFDDEPATIDAFRRALTLNPGYDPSQDASPKVRLAFEKAQQQGPIVEVVPLAVPLPVDDTAYVKKPAFWIVVGVAAIAIGIGVGAAASRSSPPSGNLGRQPLP